MSRRGKKMGVFNVRAKDSSQPLADVEYRFDSKQGVFFAEFSDQAFENPSREALREAVEECVRSRHVVDFVPMIHVELPADYRRAGWNENAGKVAEISVRCSLLMVSKQRFQHGHRDDTYQLTRPAYVDDAGEVKVRNMFGSDGRRWPTDERPWDILLPYTIDRWEALKAIQEAIVKTRGRLLELVGSATLLDQVAINGEARIGLIGAVLKGGE